jgi:hypothetical protein
MQKAARFRPPLVKKRLRHALKKEPAQEQQAEHKDHSEYNDLDKTHDT